MTALQRGLLIAALILLGLGEWVWNMHLVQSQVRQMVQAQAAKRHDRPSSLPAHKFTREQGYAFIAALKKAEAIADPLQRCLAYPDPPDSHWSRDTVVAYCRYRLPPLLSFGQMQALIQQGKSAELDRRLAAALQAQEADPASGQFDRIYEEAFRNGSFDIRPTLDAWKRASPDSAFALAASGLAYVSMAGDARGGKYMKDTPADAVNAMDNLLRQADSDLRRAIALNPKLGPAHAGLINAGALGYGDDYVDAAWKDALRAVPDDFEIYNMAMWARQPKWGGSIRAMDQLAAVAQQHAKANPMMRIMQSARPFYQVWNCDCTHEAEMAAYPQAVDELILSTDLIRLGNLSADYRNQTMALIYTSEALRFTPDDQKARVNRAYALVDYDESAWAAADLSQLLARSPGNARALDARAYAYEMQGDYRRAEQDFRALLAQNPGDMRTLSKLGDMFVNWEKNWDKGWAVADQLIREQPQNPYGLLLRAGIQEQQPRGGLDATVDQLQTRFGKDPNMAKILVRMRAAVALRKHTGIDGKPAAP
jgi:tetratricopeptide (TPR) repeat protein